jgi:hypothetical protein
MDDVPNLNGTGVTKSNPDENSKYKSEWSDSWENYKKGEYYQRAEKIMLDYGMGTGDVENILTILWEGGWFAATYCDENSLPPGDGINYHFSF